MALGPFYSQGYACSCTSSRFLLLLLTALYPPSFLLSIFLLLYIIQYHLLQLFVEPTNKSSLRPFCLPGNNGNACTLYEGSRMHRQIAHILPPLSQDYSENGKFCKTEIRILLDTKSWQIKFI